MTHAIQSAPGVEFSDRDERARRAVKAFRALQPTLSAYARVLTGDPKVRVEMSNTSNGKTDGKRIFYRPPIELGDKTEHVRKLCDKRDENKQLRCDACRQREQVLTIIYHEIAHIAYDSFQEVSEEDRADALRKAISAQGTKYAKKLREIITDQRLRSFKQLADLCSKHLPMLVNGLEDARIELKLFDARKGTRPMFEAMIWDTFTKGVPQADGSKMQWSAAPLNAQATVAIYLKACGYTVGDDWFAAEVMEALADDKVTNLCKQIWTCRSAADVYYLAFPILARMRELGFFRDDYVPEDEEEQPEPEPQPDGESEEQSEDTGSSGDDSSDEQPEDGSDSGSESDQSEPSDDTEADGDDETGDAASEDSGDRDSGPGSDSADDEADADGDDDGSSERGEAGDGEPGQGGSAASDDEGDEVEDDADTQEGSGDDAGTNFGSEGGRTGSSDTQETETEGADSDEVDDSGGEPTGSGDGSESEDSGGTGGDSLRDSRDPLGDTEDDTGSSEPEEREADDTGSDGDSGEGVADTDEQANTEDAEANAGDEVIDTGADDGTGGTEVTGSNDSIETDLPHGDPDDTEPILEEWLGHEKPESVDAEQLQADQDAVDKAIIQGLYFETPSTNVHGVREHFYGVDEIDENGVNWNQAWQRGGYYGFNSTRVGQSGEFDPDERMIGPALLKTRRVFSDNARGQMNRNLKSGKIDGGVLGKRAAMGDPRLFQKRLLPGRKSYFVCIMVDISGSTAGENIVIIKQAVMAQATLLHRAGVQFAVYCHSGQLHELNKYGWYSDERELDLEVYVVKEPDQPWDTKAITALKEIGPDAVNLDGHALEYGRRKAESVDVTDRIILYYSDGKMPAENYDEELAILQREIRHCRKVGITLLGVGIRTDSPARHGLETVQLDTADDTPKVIDQLKKYIARQPG